VLKVFSPQSPSATFVIASASNGNKLV